MLALERLVSGLTTNWLPYAVALLVLAASAVLILGSYHNAREERRLTALEAVQTFEVSITALHQYYSKEIVPRARSAGAEFAHDYRAHGDRIPFPGTIAMDFGEELRAVTPGLDTNLYSRVPFPWRAERVLDAFERASLEFFEKKPGQPYVRFETRDGIETVRLARAVVMKEDCVACHNRREFGFQQVWQTGDVRGARQVSMPLAESTPRQVPGLIWAGLVALLAAAIGGALVLPALRSLRQASETRSQFLAGVSHDLRTPLNAIIGFADVIQSRSLGDLDEKPYRAYAAYIKESGTHLLSMINQLIEIGRIESGAWPYEESEVRLTELMDHLEPILRTLVEGAGMRFELQPPPEEILLRGDETALRQILINLTDNAVKYSKGTLVRMLFVEQAKGLTIAVEDDGVGIGEEELNLLKQLHYRGARAQDGDITGFGIGLWLADRLAGLHDATLEVESKLCEGSCFGITIPPARLLPPHRPDGGP